jgi:hypothetical protein
VWCFCRPLLVSEVLVSTWLLLQLFPSSCVQRTGCVASGLNHPHTRSGGLPPCMYITRAWMDPVGSTGFLTTASTRIAPWTVAQILATCRFAWLYLRRPFGFRQFPPVGGVAPVLSPWLLPIFNACRPSSGATWLYLAVWAISSRGVLAPVFHPGVYI